MAPAELIRRVEKVVGYPPLSDADRFEDLPGKRQTANLKGGAESARPAGCQPRLGIAEWHEISVGAGRWARRAWLRC
jgi:hypothetical protein